MTKATFDLHRRLPVGALVLIVRETGVNRPCAVGVVVQHYAIEAFDSENVQRINGNRAGVEIIFEDGRSDGWSERDLELCGVLPLLGESVPFPALSNYQYRNRSSTSHDFREGVFDQALRLAKQRAATVLQPAPTALM